MCVGACLEGMQSTEGHGGGHAPHSDLRHLGGDVGWVLSGIFLATSLEHRPDGRIFRSHLQLGEGVMVGAPHAQWQNLGPLNHGATPPAHPRTACRQTDRL